MAGTVVKLRKFMNSNLFVEDVSPGSKADFQIRTESGNGQMVLKEMSGEEGFELCMALMQRLDQKCCAALGETIAKKYGYAFEKLKAK